MNKHLLRVFIAGFIAIIVLTSTLFLFEEKTDLTLVAYGFAFWALVVLFGSFGFVAVAKKDSFVTSAAFPIATVGYVIASLIFSGIAVLLEQFADIEISIPWFCVIQIVLFALLAWRLLAMRSGQEIIQETEQKVKAKTVAWKMILADAQSILGRADAASKKSVSAVCDAIRYADPMSAPELAADENAIKENLIRLEMLIDEKKTDEAVSLCITLQRQIKDRNTKVQLLK